MNREGVMRGAAVVLVGAAVLYAATRPRWGATADPYELSPRERELLAEELGEEVFEPVDLGAAPNDLDELREGDPTRWLFTAFDRCGSISVDRFAGAWSNADPAWTAPLVERGRILAGEPLRRELCLVHLVSERGDSLTALALHRRSGRRMVQVAAHHAHRERARDL